jgi:hypothetical protein
MILVFMQINAPNNNTAFSHLNRLTWEVIPHSVHDYIRNSTPEVSKSVTPEK